MYYWFCYNIKNPLKEVFFKRRATDNNFSNITKEPHTDVLERNLF